ncbi:MAG: DHH family phosphoesterase [Candidatus Magasanikbacteria bacterium]|nr:DHH family phosphoesterase [Candidatus Magasanikbacteria bacterium]
MNQIAKQIHTHLLKAKKIIVAPHQNPDGDAIGAAAAFHEYLTGLNKDAVIFCITPANDKLKFVAHSGEIVTDPIIFKDPSFDTVVVLDSGDLRYNGIAPYVANTAHTIINIDHHATNEHYGHLNLVLTSAASTTEILYHYFRHNGVRINQKMATSLLTGLTTDTGNFTNAATSSSALNASGELIRSGGNLNLVTHETLKNKSIDALRLWGTVLGRLEKDERTGITHTYLTQQDLQNYNVPDNESEGIANFLNNLEDNHIALILKELPNNQVKGSFRTTKDGVDVSALAKKLNGGGHKKAAGFTVDGTIAQVLEKIKQLL